MSKILSLIAGIAIVLGVILLVNWGWQKYQQPKMTTGALAYISESFTPLTNLPVMPGNCAAIKSTPVDPNTTERLTEVFPGSYANFALYNTGCYGDPRNQKC
jgi:hypothetical protein